MDGHKESRIIDWLLHVILYRKPAIVQFSSKEQKVGSHSTVVSITTAASAAVVTGAAFTAAATYGDDDEDDGKDD